MLSKLTYVQGITWRGSQIVIPEKMRSKVIEICHEGHMGIVKTKQQPLRSKVQFPGIDKLVENHV